jgi:hypothetical protein
MKANLGAQRTSAWTSIYWISISMINGKGYLVTGNRKSKIATIANLGAFGNHGIYGNRDSAEAPDSASR